MQQTLRTSIQAKGVARFGTEQVLMHVHPAEENTGIVFLLRKQSVQANLLSACAEYGLSLQLPDKNIRNTEKLMAAFFGMGIDNAVVELNFPEVPVMDGSATPFVFLLKAAGVCQQSQSRRVLTVKKPVLMHQYGAWARLLPSEKLSVACLRRRGEVMDTDLRDVVVDVSRANFESSLCHAGAARLRGLGMHECSDSLMNRRDVLGSLADLSLLQAQINGTYVGCGANRALNLSLMKRLISEPDAWAMYLPDQQSVSNAVADAG